MGVPILEKMNMSNFYPSKNVKKIIEEKSKILGYIGMELWDMKKEGKIDILELDVYFEKLESLEKEIREIEEEKQRAEMQKKRSGVCSCGHQVKKGMQFCPYCGKSVQNPEEKSLSQGESDPGKTGDDLQTKVRECICGAKVPEGQFMCMECGRKIE